MTKTRHAVQALAFGAATALGLPSAHAQGISLPGMSPDMAETPRSSHPPLARSSHKLFDTFTTERSFLVELGPIWSRQVQDETPAEARRGFERGAPLAGELALGMALKTPYKGLFLMGQQKTLLRVIDDKSFSWSLFHQEVGGGVRLGPFEPEVRLGLSIFTADIFHAEPSLQLFSPRVSAGVGVVLGTFRLDIHGHSEYLWRWFGPDYLVRGVTIGFRFDMPKPKSPLSYD